MLLGAVQLLRRLATHIVGRLALRHLLPLEFLAQRLVDRLIGGAGREPEHLLAGTHDDRLIALRLRRLRLAHQHAAQASADCYGGAAGQQVLQVHLAEIEFRLRGAEQGAVHVDEDGLRLAADESIFDDHTGVIIFLG